eukprot:m.11830 g.11830  ORF g.11830 m.11830 type:complete len:187 (+) comp23634_c0_seq3:1039-1599(+)
MELQTWLFQRSRNIMIRSHHSLMPYPQSHPQVIGLLGRLRRQSTKKRLVLEVQERCEVGIPEEAMVGGVGEEEEGGGAVEEAEDTQMSTILMMMIRILVSTGGAVAAAAAADQGAQEVVTVVDGEVERERMRKMGGGLSSVHAEGKAEEESLFQVIQLLKERKSRLVKLKEIKIVVLGRVYYPRSP